MNTQKRIALTQSFFRPPFDPKAHIEDGSIVYPQLDIFGVFDGCSAAYSPNCPPKMYPGGFTGGQIPYREAQLFLPCANIPISLEQFLLKVNRQVLSIHQDARLDPTRQEDVGGACFAFCQPGPEGLKIIMGGDCFAVVMTDNWKSATFLTAFDEACYRLECENRGIFAKCKKEANGDMGKAWDFYRPIYAAKRVFRANQNFDQGGVAILNGDPVLERCWLSQTFPWDHGPRMVILGTDGLLPSSAFDPDHSKTLARQICQLYSDGGIQRLLAWRDQVEAEEATTQHLVGWPEATAVVLKFGLL